MYCFQLQEIIIIINIFSSSLSIMHLSNQHVFLTSDKIEHEQLTTYSSHHETAMTEDIPKNHCQASLDALLHRLREIVPQMASDENTELSTQRNSEWTANIVMDTVLYIRFLHSTLITTGPIPSSTISRLSSNMRKRKEVQSQNLRQV